MIPKFFSPSYVPSPFLVVRNMKETSTSDILHTTTTTTTKKEEKWPLNKQFILKATTTTKNKLRREWNGNNIKYLVTHTYYNDIKRNWREAKKKKKGLSLRLHAEWPSVRLRLLNTYNDDLSVFIISFLRSIRKVWLFICKRREEKSTHIEVNKTFDSMLRAICSNMSTKGK